MKILKETFKGFYLILCVIIEVVILLPFIVIVHAFLGFFRGIRVWSYNMNESSLYMHDGGWKINIED